MAAIISMIPASWLNFIATNVRMELPNAQAILEEIDSIPRKVPQADVPSLLKEAGRTLELGRKIQTEAQSEMEKMQRDHSGREQLEGHPEGTGRRG